MCRQGYYGADGVECPITYCPPARGGPPVVLLHGYSFTGEVWRDVGVLAALEQRSIGYGAPDMPYGRRTGCSKRSRSLHLNLKAVEAVVSMLGGEPPLLVGASLGGRVALYYAVSHDVKGLLLASPAVREDEDIWRLTRSIRVPTLILRGSRDFVPASVHERLAEKLAAKLVVYEGAGHVLYRDQPERFIRDLLEFYSSLAGTRALS